MRDHDCPAEDRHEDGSGQFWSIPAALAVEVDRAAEGLLWLHPQRFAERRGRSGAGVQGVVRQAPTAEEQRSERSRWVQKFMRYPEPLRAAVPVNCKALFQAADEPCPPVPECGCRHGRVRLTGVCFLLDCGRSLVRAATAAPGHERT